MSDSDETICNEGESESEEQNSPSILSSWYATYGKQKEISGASFNPILFSGGKTNLIKINVDEFSPGSGSPEFPLLSRRLKRKEDLTEPNHSDDNSKVFRGEAGSLDSTDEKRRNTKVGPTHLTQTLGESEVDDTTNTEALLVNLETKMRELEIEQSSGGVYGGNVNDGRLEDVKSQLAVLQNALIDANHKHRVTRKKIISGEGCGQLAAEEKKQAILNLARKQRNVLEVFKKYKNLTQRLRQLTGQKESNASKESKCPKNSDDLSVKSKELTQNRVVSSAAAILSETGIKEVSTTKLPVHQPSPSVTFVEESAAAKINDIEQTHRNHPDKDIKTVNAIKSTQHPRANVKPAPANIYQVIVVPSSSGVPVTQNFASVYTNGSNGVPIINRSKTHITLQPNKVITNQSASKQTVTRPTPSSETLARNTIPTSQAQSLKTYQTPSSSSAMSHNGLIGMATAIYPTNTTNILSCTRPDGPPTSKVTASQSIQDQTQRRQGVQTESICTAVRQPHKTVTILGNCQSNINQLLTKPFSGTSFSLETLVKDGVLTSGKNVLTATAEGKLYSASLSEKGTIVSAGGEGFTSPRSWVKAILGSKRKVKLDVAWKMVSYKGKSLLDFANKTITESTKQKTLPSSSSISKPNAVQDSVTTDNERRKQITNLINSRAALNALLRNCRVSPVEREELVSSEEILTKDFWEKTEFELESLNKDILFGLEF